MSAAHVLLALLAVLPTLTVVAGLTSLPLLVLWLSARPDFEVDLEEGAWP